MAAGVRTALLTTALSDDLGVAKLSAVAGSDAVDDALHAGVLVVDGEARPAAHPLLAAVARKRSRVRERREAHRVLAGVMDDGPLRALHLALASTEQTRTSPESWLPAHATRRRGASVSRPWNWLVMHCA